MAINSAVHCWQMTEEERLAYIEKHPIVPIENKSGAGFSSQTYMQEHRKLKTPSVFDGMDLDYINQLYIDGMLFKDMAEELGVSRDMLDRFIRQQRKVEPDKWIMRQPRRSIMW